MQDRLADQLPENFGGFPVRFSLNGEPAEHHVTVTTLSRWLEEFLGVDASRGMSDLDWLLTPQQRMLGVFGPVYADPNGALAAVQRELSWYPEHVWRWLLACQWHRLAQEEAFVARTTEVGDHLGSALSAARLGTDLVRLTLQMDRTYAPYQKWLGTAFAASERRHDDGLMGHLGAALKAVDAVVRGRVGNGVRNGGAASQQPGTHPTDGRRGT